MKIAITGASGFIGSVLVPLLLADGHELRMLTRSIRTQDGVTFITGDLIQEQSLKELVAGSMLCRICNPALLSIRICNPTFYPFELLHAADTLNF